MSEYDPALLEHWRKHMHDFVLIHSPRSPTDPLPPGSPVPYVIHNMLKKRHYHIEDGRIRCALVEEMIAAGVKTLTWKEGFKILYLKRYEELSEKGLFEKFWQVNFPYDVD